MCSLLEPPGKAALYWHFPNGKEELFEAVLQHIGRAWRAQVKHKIGGGSQAAKVRQLFKNYGRWPVPRPTRRRRSRA